MVVLRPHKNNEEDDEASPSNQLRLAEQEEIRRGCVGFTTRTKMRMRRARSSLVHASFF